MPKHLPDQRLKEPEHARTADGARALFSLRDLAMGQLLVFRSRSGLVPPLRYQITGIRHHTAAKWNRGPEACATHSNDKLSLSGPYGVEVLSAGYCMGSANWSLMDDGSA